MFEDEEFPIPSEVGLPPDAPPWQGPDTANWWPWMQDANWKADPYTEGSFFNTLTGEWSNPATDPNNTSEWHRLAQANAPDPRVQSLNNLRIDETNRYALYIAHLTKQLQQTEMLADKARQEQHWQFVEDLAFRREALLKQLAEAEKGRQLQKRGQQDAREASSGWKFGQIGMGV